MGKVATVRDVAEAADVSIATVSRVVNEKGTVDPELRRRVMEAVERLGYQRDRVGRSLRQGSTMVWGLVVGDVENPFFAALVGAVQEGATRDGYSLLLCNQHGEPVEERRSLRLLREERVAGVIISPVSGSAADAEAVAAAGMPVVLLDRYPSEAELDIVRVDHVEAAYLGTRHLLERGYQRVACIEGHGYMATSVDRLEGYRRALAEAGVPYDPALVRDADYRTEGGYRAAQALLRDRHRPDAMIVMNNLMAEGALRAVRESGLHMPDQIGLVGFEEPPWATLIEPGLTTITLPISELGKAAAELLGRRCRQDFGDFPNRRLLSATLMVRGSSQGPG